MEKLYGRILDFLSATLYILFALSAVVFMIGVIAMEFVIRYIFWIILILILLAVFT